MKTIDDLAEGVDAGKQMDIILLDFSKAFDKVPHQRLLTKLHHYGIQGNPQGTVIGPLLFLRQWTCDWQITFNPDKCVVMHITRRKNKWKTIYNLNGVNLAEVKNTKYLGVSISNDLSWHDHISTTSSKAARSVGFLRRNLCACPEEVRARMYTTLVRPIMEYAGAVWDPYQARHTDKLERVQKQAARSVTNNYSSREEGSMTAMLDHLGWEPLAVRRARARATLLYKIINNVVEVEFSQTIHQVDARTRGATRGSLRQIQVKTDTYQNSFLPRTITTWNNIPSEIKAAATVESSQSSLRPEDLTGRLH